MVKTFKQAVGGIGKNVSGGVRTQQDISMRVVLVGIILIAVAMV